MNATLEGGVVTDDSIQEVLDEVRAVAAALVELRADVTKATQHFGDVDALQIDVEAIKEHMVKLDAFIYGDPPLLDRLERLERKQESDDQARQAEDAETREGAGTAGDSEHREMARDEAGGLVTASEARQDEINVEFRAGLGRVERAIFDILHASLKVKAGMILGAGIVISILARALGA